VFYSSTDKHAAGSQSLNFSQNILSERPLLIDEVAITGENDAGQFNFPAVSPHIFWRAGRILHLFG
jgi:hypothetical protein